MGLGSKKNFKIFEKRDASDKYFVSNSDQTRMSSSYASAEHIKDAHTFETMKPILFQLQLIEEDIDEIRRFSTGSGEIDVNGGVF